MNILHRLIRLRPAQPTQFTGGPLAPLTAFAAIGDIHGSAAPLTRLLKRLTDEFPPLPLVFTGDYIDRGNDSAAVLDQLCRLARTWPQPVRFLAGNHEDMLLRFLAAPAARTGDAATWLRHGGLQTLAAFAVPGLAGLSPHSPPEKRQAAADALAQALGPAKIAWLQGLPAWWQSGNVAVVHAGADPDLPLGLQPRQVLLNGHRDFGRRPRGDGCWIVCGHRLVTAPAAARGIVRIDTGAFATGRLSAAVISKGEVRFVQS